MKLIIEVLFPEVCNLFGDIGNIRYLEQSLPDAEFVYTALNDKPRFADDDVSLIYMGAMTEKTQCDVIERLTPYKERLKSLIDGGTAFFTTGNAMEVFGNKITDVSGELTKGLGLIDIDVSRDMMHRFSGLILGEFDGYEIVGFRAQFTTARSGDATKSFIKINKGKAMNSDCEYEGVRVNNFFGTYILGPFLVLNPLFTKSLLKIVCGKDVEVAFEKETMLAYEERLKDFKRKQVKIK